MSCHTQGWDLVWKGQLGPKNQGIRVKFLLCEEELGSG